MDLMILFYAFTNGEGDDIEVQLLASLITGDAMKCVLLTLKDSTETRPAGREMVVYDPHDTKNPRIYDKFVAFMARLLTSAIHVKHTHPASEAAEYDMILLLETWSLTASAEFICEFLCSTHSFIFK